MIEVAIYAGAPAMRQRLSTLLSECGRFRVAGAAERLPALAQLWNSVAVDVVLADTAEHESAADFFDATRGIPVVLLAGDYSIAHMRMAFDAGAAAVLSRGASGIEIELSLIAASRSLRVLPQHLLDALLGEDHADSSENREISDSRALTQREIEVLTVMADGASNKVIARRLGISFHTVKFHVASIMAKLDADSRTEAVLEAARRGLVML